MSIRKVFDWLKNKGIAQKYNPYHHPAGSPMGGKFAPKAWALGIGTARALHVTQRTPRQQLKHRTDKLRKKGISIANRNFKAGPTTHGYDVASGYAGGLQFVAQAANKELRNVKGVSAKRFHRTINKELKQHQKALKKKGITDQERRWRQGRVKGLEHALSDLTKHVSAADAGPRLTKREQKTRFEASMKAWNAIRRAHGWD